MKKNTIFDSLKTSKFRHGGYATLLILAAVVILVVINVLVEQIPWKADLSENKIFTLSDQTRKLTSALSTDIRIVSLTKPGQEDPMVMETLRKYTVLSRHMKLETIDPDKNPAWAKQYTTAGQNLMAGTLVVIGPKRFKTITPYDLYSIDYQTNPNQPQITGLAVEQRVTAALQYVTVEANPVVYELQGQSEATLVSTGLQTAVENQNYDVKPLSLLSQSSIPGDAALLMILYPKTDVTVKEAEIIKTYLEGGGRAMITLGFSNPGITFPNLDGLLKSYGVQPERVLIMEGDASRHYPNNPAYLLPKLGTHEILTPLSTNDLPVLLPEALGIQTLELKKRTTTVEPLLTTTQNSWGKVNYGNVTTFSKEKGDVEGPFNLAVAITDQPTDPNAKDTRIVVVGCGAFIDANVLSIDPTNSDLFMNSLSWLRNQKDTISIQAKSLYNLPLRLNQLQSLLLSGLVVILMPLLVLGAGFVVWMRRRHL